jgi:hypothetical protein
METSGLPGTSLIRIGNRSVCGINHRIEQRTGCRVKEKTVKELRQVESQMTKVEDLRAAIKQTAGRDSSLELCAVLEDMLDRGMLQYRQGSWSTDGSNAMLDRIYAMHDELAAALLALFLEQKVLLCTKRRGVPGIYFYVVVPKQ